MFDWLRSLLDQLRDRAEAHGRQRWIDAARWGEVVVETIRQVTSQRSLQIAASLSFTTILSVVPLIAVSFAVMAAFVPDAEIARTVRDWLLSTLLADSVAGVVDLVESFLDRANGGAVGAVGTVFLLVTSLSLFLSIESSFNSIWRVPLSRPLHRRLTTFYAVITLTPALIGVGVFFANTVRQQLADYSLGLSVGAGALSWGLMVLGLTLMYKLLPHTTVGWKVAVAGALGASIALLIVRTGFNFYIDRIYAGGVQSKIYGTFALIPVFFLWVYVTWIIVLAGNIMAYTVQHRDSLTRALLRRRRRQGEPAPPNGYLLSRVFLLVARHFRLHGGGLAPDKIAARLQIELNEVNPTVRVLRDGGLLLQVVGRGPTELVPARPLDRVRLVELYQLGEADGYQPGELPGGPFDVLERQLASAQSQRDEVLSMTVDEVLGGSIEGFISPSEPTASSEGLAAQDRPSAGDGVDDSPGATAEQREHADNVEVAGGPEGVDAAPVTG